GDIDAAALALAVAEAGGTGPADRLVAGDRIALEGEGRVGVNKDASAQTVAAVAHAAAGSLGQVVGNDGIDDGGADAAGGQGGAPRVGDAATTGHPADGPGATDGLVVVQHTVAEGQGAGICQGEDLHVGDGAAFAEAADAA